MINTMKMYEELSETMDSKSAKKIVEMMSYMYEEIQNTVTKTEFNELKDIVKDLSIKVGELTTGQKALAEAQKRTEDKVTELAEAQKRTEDKVTELAETLTKLVKEHDDTKRQMGGIAQSIGYNLEDKAYKALPALLKRDFNITIEGRLIRDYVKDNKEREFEVNIFGKGKRGGKDIIIIGESKTVLSENDIKSFIRKRIETLKDVFKEEIFPVLVTRSVSNSKVKEFAKSVNLHIYYSYDF
ncbi:MAG TPA: chordopoxvirus fusion protein [Candidatus Eremiobacteraeota bacterium]|nr:chordopoxvirus fusion protein [Candidatus Eremiobacteraeota bacterium]